jgi:deoxyribose-phosphate aldolase
MFEAESRNINRMIDISGVRADVTLEEIDMIVKASIENNFICAFAMPCFTSILVEKLSDYKDIFVGGVVGFPSGADTTSIKVAQAKEMLAVGVDELDMVINVGAMKSQKYSLVHDDIKAIVETGNGKPVKSILEICYLSDYEIAKASEIAVDAGVTYVKTGTGWGNKPTTVETIKIIKNAIGDSAFIKAAGGVRDLKTINKMIKEGCTRFGLGLYTALNIVEELNK